MKVMYGERGGGRCPACLLGPSVPAAGRPPSPDPIPRIATAGQGGGLEGLGGTDDVPREECREPERREEWPPGQYIDHCFAN